MSRHIPLKYQWQAKGMLEELDAGRLEVCKVPSRQGGYIRVPVSTNAEWYRHFCKRFETSRRRYPKPRTIIKRCHTRRTLIDLVAGKDGTVYSQRLLDFMRFWKGEK